MNAEEQALLKELDAALAQLPADLSLEEVESLLRVGNYEILNTIQDRIIPDHSNLPTMAARDFVFRSGEASGVVTIDQMVAAGFPAFSPEAEYWGKISQYQNYYFFSYRLPEPTYNTPIQPAVALGEFGNIDATRHNDLFVYNILINALGEREDVSRSSLVTTTVESNDLELAA